MTLLRPLITPFKAAEYLAAYGANFNIRNSLGQRPIDVLTAQKLIPKIRDLSKNRPKRESLPELPELPPFSLPEPQPEVSTCHYFLAFTASSAFTKNSGTGT